ncbi:MAG: hypothetical protein WCP95_02320 [Actinomycetes bacterium]
MSTTGPVSNDLLREVIRDVVREVIREVVAEEMAAAALTRTVSPSAHRSPPTAGTVSSGTRVDRGALTERHVRAAGPKTTITIGRTVVITPLAKERAKSMGVEIIRIQE